MSLLASRYELSDASDAVRGMSLATDTESGERVVVKELTLGRIDDWKQLDLFQRETRALAQLDHPGVPAFVDSFDHDADGEPRFYLVQSYVEGTSLADAITAIEITDEQRLRQIARDTLEVLAYLQSFSPPVLHRDVKPANIILRPNGGVALVDFGTVAVKLEGTAGGSTVVGTTGYMAPEQLIGRAVPASDLYGLGASLVHAMTGIHPADLPMERMKLQWRTRARVGSERFHGFVDGLIEPLAADRPANAPAALRLLGGEGSRSLTKPSDGILAARPADTYIEFRRSRNRLRVRFGKQSAFVAHPGRLLFLAGVAALFTGLFTFLFGWTAPVSILGASAGAVFLLAAGVFVVGRTTPPPLLELDADRGYRIRCRETGNATKTGAFDQIIGPDTGYGAKASSFFLATKGQIYELSHSCSRAEQEWLADEIASFLNEHRA